MEKEIKQESTNNEKIPKEEVGTEEEVNSKEKETLKGKEPQEHDGKKPVMITKETEGRLSRIEILLVSQAEHNKKMLSQSRVRTIILLIFTAIIAIGVVAMLVLGGPMFAEGSQLIDSVRGLSDSATVELENISAIIDGINIDELTDAVKNISEAAKQLAGLDFDGINEGIAGLNEGVMAFQSFAEALSNPLSIFD